MSYQFPPDIATIVHNQIAAGLFETEDEVLRAALASLSTDEEEDLRAIQASIDDMERGDAGQSAEEVFAELRSKYDFPVEP